jgi:hypothetical protein
MVLRVSTPPSCTVVLDLATTHQDWSHPGVRLRFRPILVTARGGAGPAMMTGHSRLGGTESALFRMRQELSGVYRAPYPGPRAQNSGAYSTLQYSPAHTMIDC